MIYICILISVTFALINGLPPPTKTSNDPEVLGTHANRFLEFYGLATDLMNLGGSILNNAKSENRNDFGRYGRKANGYSANSVLGDAFRFFDREGSDNLISPSYKSSMHAPGYGGGNLGISGAQNVRSARQNIFETLLNTFLGSSLSVSSTASPQNLLEFFSPKSQQKFAESNSQSNIESLLNALVRSGAKRATPNPNLGSNLFSSLLGKR